MCCLRTVPSGLLLVKLVRVFYYVTQLNQKGPAGCFFLTGELLTKCQGAVWVSRNGGFPDLCLCICVNAPCGPRVPGAELQMVVTGRHRPAECWDKMQGSGALTALPAFQPQYRVFISKVDVSLNRMDQSRQAL